MFGFTISLNNTPYSFSIFSRYLQLQTYILKIEWPNRQTKGLVPRTGDCCLVLLAFYWFLLWEIFFADRQQYLHKKKFQLLQSLHPNSWDQLSNSSIATHEDTEGYLSSMLVYCNKNTPI